MAIALKLFILSEGDKPVLKIGKHTFQSRLFLGTGKFSSLDVQKKAVDVSGTEVLTFAVRRMNLFDPEQPNFLEMLDLKKYKLLPNTAGATTAEEAVRIRPFGPGSNLCDMIKVEVIGDSKTLLPDPVETLKATRMLVEEGFTVLSYTLDDPVLARKLWKLGPMRSCPEGRRLVRGKGY